LIGRGVNFFRKEKIMANNFVQEGKTITVAAPSGGCVAGRVGIHGSLVGVYATTQAEGADVELNLEGVWEVTKSAPLVIAQGDALYVNSVTKAITKTVSDVLAGVAAAAAAELAVLVKVKLKGGVSGDDAELAAASAHVADVTGADHSTLKASADAADTHVADVTGADHSTLKASADAADTHVADVTGADHSTLAAEVVAAAKFDEFYQVTFVGAAAAGNIAPTLRSNGFTAEAGDKLVMITGYVTIGGAKIAMPTVGATDFDDLLIDDTGVIKLQQINAGDLSANTYEALVLKKR